MGFGALLKYILFTLNLVFAFVGLALLGITVYLRSITPMGAGVVVFLVAFLGCCGAIRESNFMLVTYAIFMLSVMAVQLVIAIMVFVRLDALIALVLRWLDEVFKNNQSAFHKLESEFTCCGTTGFFSYGTLNLPPSCCPKNYVCKNILTFVGLALLGITVYLRSITPMGAGVVVFLVAFLGCCGAIRESNFMLVTYAIFMLSVMAVQLVIAIMVFVRLDALIALVLRWLDEVFKNNQSAFHKLESEFTCCGTTGFFSYGTLNLPPSCCPKNYVCKNILTGCNTVVDGFFHTNRTSIGMVAFVVAAIALVAVMLALCLANHARRNNASSHLPSLSRPKC